MVPLFARLRAAMTLNLLGLDGLPADRNALTVAFNATMTGLRMFLRV